MIAKKQVNLKKDENDINECSSCKCTGWNILECRKCDKSVKKSGKKVYWTDLLDEDDDDTEGVINDLEN